LKSGGPIMVDPMLASLNAAHAPNTSIATSSGPITNPIWTGPCAGG
jgi:hypothetical protein